MLGYISMIYVVYITVLYVLYTINFILVIMVTLTAANYQSITFATSHSISFDLLWG